MQQVGSHRPRELVVHHLGRVPYAQALAQQTQIHAAVVAGLQADTLLLLEHPPVITTGRQTVAANVLIDTAEMTRRGIDYCETGRGGDVTYHGPGQLVGYPIIALQEGEQDVRGYVHRLEEILIRTAADFGVTAVRVQGLRGIWVGNDKLAAIGIRLARWVTLHGFALNVCTDLKDFATIVPCGLHGRGVTSLAVLCAEPPSVAAVAERIVHHTGEILGRACRTP
jgi:lipoate-protein ligase B